MVFSKVGVTYKKNAASTKNKQQNKTKKDKAIKTKQNYKNKTKNSLRATNTIWLARSNMVESW